jgi:hypothetical protein
MPYKEGTRAVDEAEYEALRPSPDEVRRGLETSLRQALTMAHGQTTVAMFRAAELGHRDMAARLAEVERVLREAHQEAATPTVPDLS